MIRSAQFGDIPRLVDILAQTHAASVYADVVFNDREAKRVLMGAIQRNGMVGDGGALCLVHERDNQVQGMLFLAMQRLYLVGDALMATDLFFVVTDQGDARAASKLVSKATAWCGKHGIRDVYFNLTAVAGDPARVGKLLSRRGFKPFGVIYRAEVTP